MSQNTMLRIRKWFLGTVVGAVVIGLATNYIYDNIKPSSDNNTVVLDKDISNKLLKEYVKKVEDLKKDKNTTQEELNKAKLELARKVQELKELKKLLKNNNYKIVQKAKDILEKEGIDKALSFLKSQELKNKETLLSKNMKEMAETYKLQANLLMLKNRYKEAKDALKMSLKYDRSADNLFDYAKFLQEQHYFKEAKEAYSEALKIYKELAKENPKVYGIELARTLLACIND